MDHDISRYRVIDGKTIYIGQPTDGSTGLGPRSIQKAHVKGHIRVIDGKTVWVTDHEDTRKGRAAKLHERTVLGEHKEKGHYLRATDADDAATIRKTIERMGAGVTRANSWKGQANHLGHVDTYEHFKVDSPEHGARILEELAQAPENPEPIQSSLFEDEPAEFPPSSTAELARGASAMERVIAGKGAVNVPDAFERPGLGTISIYWGKEGIHPDKPFLEASGRERAYAFKKGSGVAKIIAKRDWEGSDGGEAARSMIPTIGLGDVGPIYGPEGGQRRDITYQGSQAVLSLYKDDHRETWLLTGFPEHGAPGEPEKVHHNLEPTPPGPTDIRSEGGAGAETNVIPPEEPSKAPEGPQEGDRNEEGLVFHGGRWHREDEPAPTEPVKADQAEPAPEPEKDSTAAMRQRLTIQEPEGSAYEKKYGTAYVLKDGERVAKIGKWSRATDKSTLYSINDLKERKSRGRSIGTDPSLIINPCESLDDALDKYAMHLFAEDQEKKARESAKKERAAMIRQRKRAAAIANATPATRTEATLAQSDGPEPMPDNPEPYDFTPFSTTVTVDGQEHEVSDYTSAIPARVTLANRKTILDTPRPSFIPEISADWFNRMSGRLEGVKLGEDRYLITVERPRGTRMGHYESGDDQKKFALVNLATLVATQDYYSKLGRAKHDRDVANAGTTGELVGQLMTWMKEHDIRGISSLSQVPEDLTPGLTEAQRNQAHHTALSGLNEYRIYGRGASLPDYIEKLKAGMAARLKRDRPTIIASNKITLSHQNLITATFPEIRPGSRPSWDAFHAYLNDLKQGSSDMELQMEETANTHTKGRETSYGRAGAQDDLLESHGVVVKRQNGDEIAPFEVEEIKRALDDVYSVFGDRAELSKRTKLLISHAGVMNQHASRAVGLYLPGRTAIGVTWANGDTSAGFTLAHEFAHFMDNQLGKMGGRNHYASDDRASVEGRIATAFRRNMQAPQKSDYQNRTCECFARAMEQFFATAHGKEKAYQALNNAQGNHPTHEDFQKHVQPLVEEFLTTRGPLLKAMKRMERL